MSAAQPASLRDLIVELERLPGVGARSASRLAYHLLRVPESEAVALADAIRAARGALKPCSRCQAPSETEPCALCSDPRRRRDIVLVVETARDMLAVEAAGRYEGLYFVLGGRMSPLDGGPDVAGRMQDLARRAAEDDVEEICLGTNPDLEGDGAARAAVEALQSVGVRVTRLARGLPTGGQIEYQNAAAIADAFEGRRAL